MDGVTVCRVILLAGAVAVWSVLILGASGFRKTGQPGPVMVVAILAVTSAAIFRLLRGSRFGIELSVLLAGVIAIASLVIAAMIS
jgi:hypothetical protein